MVPLSVLVDDGSGTEVFDEVERLQSLGWSVTSVRETSAGLVIVLRKDK